MHLHLVRVAAPPKGPRPAKVVSLEVRRQARLEAAQPKRPAPRSAACTTSRTLCSTSLRLIVRMWRNRDTHRPQKPAAERP